MKLMTTPAPLPYNLPDSRFEMPALFTPGKKPVGAVKLAGIEATVWLIDQTLNSLCGRYPLTLVDTSTVEVNSSGYYLECVGSTSRFGNSDFEGECYGLVFHLTMAIADATDSTSTLKFLYFTNASTGDYLVLGPATGYIDGEVITHLTTLTREGGTTPIPVGEHVIAMLWENGTYNWYMDGKAMPMLYYGTSVRSTFSGGLRLYPYENIAAPRLRIHSLMAITVPHSLNGENITADPYQFLVPA